MKELLRETTAYRAFAGRDVSHTTLVLFPDEKYLRALLKECAKAFFGAEEDSRIARLVDGESFSDCLIYPAAGGKLTADDCAGIVDESLMRPVEGEKKLFVLDAFHAASPIVQNKLLKVLEEPPAGSYFLLGATAEHNVLPTVLSRAGRIAVPPFSEEQILRALQRNRGGGGLREAAAASGGIYSVAESLAEGGGEIFRLAERFLSLADCEKLCRELDGTEKTEFLSAVRLTLRDMLLRRTGREKYVARGGEAIAKLAADYPAGAILSAQKFMSEAEREIKFNANLGQCALALAMKIAKEKEKWQKLS